MTMGTRADVGVVEVAGSVISVLDQLGFGFKLVLAALAIIMIVGCLFPSRADYALKMTRAVLRIRDDSESPRDGPTPDVIEPPPDPPTPPRLPRQRSTDDRDHSERQRSDAHDPSSP
jgi:hypothetical protein